MSIHDLPAVNASLNGLSAIFLTAGFIFIKRGNKIMHRNCMISAFVTSVIFLACYLTYHIYLGVVLHQGPTKFLNPIWFRPIYLTIHFDAHNPRHRHRAVDFDYHLARKKRTL